MVMINAELVRTVSISRLGGGASKWKSLFNFVCSGPPPHRLKQLLQLHRAGIVRFLGPQTCVELGPADFIASSSSGTRFVHADALIEAYLPRPTLQNTANELMRNLMHQGGIRESATQPGFIDIDAGFHVVDAGGRVRHNLWAVGPATAEIPAGAFARPGTDAAAFRRNDSLARDILQEIAAPARGQRRSVGLGRSPEILVIAAAQQLKPLDETLGVAAFDEEEVAEAGDLLADELPIAGLGQ